MSHNPWLTEVGIYKKKGFKKKKERKYAFDQEKVIFKNIKRKENKLMTNKIKSKKPRFLPRYRPRKKESFKISLTE